MWKMCGKCGCKFERKYDAGTQTWLGLSEVFITKELRVQPPHSGGNRTSRQSAMADVVLGVAQGLVRKAKTKDF